MYCKKCEKQRYPGDFYKDKTKSSGYRSTCKYCAEDYRKFGWSGEGRPKLEGPQKELRRLETTIRRDYGITLDSLVWLMDNQKGCCAVCGDSLMYPDSEKRYSIDHSHTTGNVRGLLCSTCNVGIGLLGDDLEALEKAVDYLKRTPRI